MQIISKAYRPSGASGSTGSTGSTEKLSHLPWPSLWLLTCLCITAVENTSATVVDLRDPLIENLDGANTLTVATTDGPVTLTTASGVFNRTAAGFGINAPGGRDDADAIDGDVVDEWVSVMFAHDIRLLGVTLSGIGRSDIAVIETPDAQLRVTTSGTVAFSDLTLNTDQSLRIGHLFGNGFSLDRFAFEQFSFTPSEPSEPPTRVVSAGEPGTLALVFLAGIATVVGRSRRAPRRGPRRGLTTDNIG